MVNSHEKKYQNYFLRMVKCRWHFSFEEIDTEPSIGKNDGYWLLWGIFKEYIYKKIIMAVLPKANYNSVYIYRLIKNQ